MNCDVECHTGSLCYPVNNYETKILVNCWNRSTVKSYNWFGGICGWSGAMLIYCYSDLTDDGSTGRYGIAPISNSTTNLYECLYYAAYTPSDARGTAVTEANLQSASFLRDRGWLI